MSVNPSPDSADCGERCRHCSKPPEADGDHTCTCPYPDDFCPDHPRPEDPWNTDEPVTNVREYDSWWWERPNAGGDLGYSRPDVLMRCQRIWGGRIKVIRQTITTVTTTSVLTPGSEKP